MNNQFEYHKASLKIDQYALSDALYDDHNDGNDHDDDYEMESTVQSGFV